MDTHQALHQHQQIQTALKERLQKILKEYHKGKKVKLLPLSKKIGVSSMHLKRLIYGEQRVKKDHFIKILTKGCDYTSDEVERAWNHTFYTQKITSNSEDTHNKMLMNLSELPTLNHQFHFENDIIAIYINNNLERNTLYIIKWTDDHSLHAFKSSDQGQKTQKEYPLNNIAEELGTNTKTIQNYIRHIAWNEVIRIKLQRLQIEQSEESATLEIPINELHAERNYNLKKLIKKTTQHLSKLESKLTKLYEYKF